MLAGNRERKRSISGVAIRRKSRQAEAACPWKEGKKGHPVVKIKKTRSIPIILQGKGRGKRGDYKVLERAGKEWSFVLLGEERHRLVGSRNNGVLLVRESLPRGKPVAASREKEAPYDLVQD